MAFNVGGGFGGALSGAATGSALGPIGSVIGGIGGLLTGGFGGGGPEEYEPTELEAALAEYGPDQIKAVRAKRKAIAAQYQNLLTGGNRGGAEAFLEAERYKYTNPAFIDRKLKRSYKEPIDYSSGSYRALADSLYGQQGVGLGDDIYSEYGERAKGLNIRSPQAFADMVKQDMIASGKVKTAQQEMLSYMFGDPARTSDGRVTNLYARYIPSTERKAAAAASPIT